MRHRTLCIQIRACIFLGTRTFAYVCGAHRAAVFSQLDIRLLSSITTTETWNAALRVTNHIPCHRDDHVWHPH